jgi:hypothetical protein
MFCSKLTSFHVLPPWKEKTLGLLGASPHWISRISIPMLVFQHFQPRLMALYGGYLQPLPKSMVTYLTVFWLNWVIRGTAILVFIVQVRCAFHLNYNPWKLVASLMTLIVYCNYHINRVQSSDYTPTSVPLWIDQVGHCHFQVKWLCATSR